MGLSENAERIASVIFRKVTGIRPLEFDHSGKQRAVDFVIPIGADKCHWGALEVTFVLGNGEVLGLLEKDGWRWPANEKWEFRPLSLNFKYREIRPATVKAARLCEEQGLSTVRDMPDDLSMDQTVRMLFESGFDDLSRRDYGDTGIIVFPPAIVGFLDADPPLEQVIDGWMRLDHLPPHLEKLREFSGTGPKHLFLVVGEDDSPPKYFTDDFDCPTSPLREYEGIDYVWLWSNFWHSTLCFSNASRTWTWRSWNEE